MYNKNFIFRWGFISGYKVITVRSYLLLKFIFSPTFVFWTDKEKEKKKR
jgi:hypothetical protein